MKLIKPLGILLFLGFFNPILKSQTDTINCFIDVQDIYDLDFNRGTAMVDFYLSLKYNKPLAKEVYLLNGSITKIDTLIDNEAGQFLCLRILAEVRNTFEFKHYPLDKQQIIIKIEPYLYYKDAILYSHPLQNHIIGDLNLNGWIANKIIFENKISKYESYDNDSVKIYQYSDANFIIPIVRKESFFYAVKIFIPSIVSILIIYIGLFLPPQNVESRLNLSVGSLFVMISNFIVTQQMLPSISNITLVEKVNIFCLLIVFSTIVYFAISYRLQEKPHGKALNVANYVFIAVNAIFYSLLIYTFV